MVQKITRLLPSIKRLSLSQESSIFLSGTVRLMRTKSLAFSPNELPGIRANFSSLSSFSTKMSQLNPVLDMSARRNMPDCGIIGSTLLFFLSTS